MGNRHVIRLFLWQALFSAPLAALQQRVSEDDIAVREQLESLLRTNEFSAGFIAAALGVAFLAGAAHALTPGHGKAIVAAYLTGSRGTIGDAVYLGSVVTITHTATVFLLGLAALYASQHFLMDDVFRWLSLASGLIIVVIGGGLFWSRWRAMRSGESGEHHSHWPLGGHSHSHSHEHPHSHDHTHDPSRDDARSHDGAHSHDDPPRPRATRGSLLSLGISGGLVPCPEALAVLLISFTINRLLFGMVILAAFSLGLAAVLIAIGVAMVMAGPALSRFSKDGPLVRMLPIGSAAVVTLLGVAILYKTAADSGIL